MAFSEVAAHVAKEVIKTTAEAAKKTADVTGKATKAVAAKSLVGGEKGTGWAYESGIKSAVNEMLGDISGKVRSEISKLTEAQQLPSEIGEKTEAENLPDEVGNANIETDDMGRAFKIDGELIPNTEYECNGIKYKTDDLGRKTSWEGKPQFSPEAERDTLAQVDAGGEDRLAGDDGGHLVARITGGSSGNENLVAMRDTINRGDYKRAENEIVNALKRGCEVSEQGSLTYAGETSRPSKIEMQYQYDDVMKILTVDNVEGSQDLIESISVFLSSADYSSLLEEIKDMSEDGGPISVTSTLKSIDADGVVRELVVGIRDEAIGEKIYRTFSAVEEVLV